MTCKKKGIIFDLDGVIINSYAVMKKSFDYAFAKFFPNQESVFEDYVRFSGRGFHEIMQIMRLPSELYPLFFEKNLELTSEIIVYPGMTEILTELYHNRVYLGVSTGKDSIRTNKILVQKNLLSLFNKVISSDQVKFGKPDPETIRMHVNESRLRKEDFVLVGDSPADIECAKNAQITSVATLWGMGKYSELKLSKPDYFVQKPEELKEIFKELGLLQLDIVLNKVI